MATAKLNLTTGVVYVRDWSGTLTGTELNLAAVIATNISVTALATPSAPTVTPRGTTGATTYSYKVVARNSLGVSVASAAGTTNTGNATLSTTNYNEVTWSAVSKAVSYDIYRTVGGATQGQIGNTTGLALNDTGLTGGGEPAPTTTTTGIILADAVGIGTTSPAIPQAKLHIVPGASHGLKLDGFGTGDFNAIDLQSSGLSGTGDYFINAGTSNYWRADGLLAAQTYGLNTMFVSATAPTIASGFGTSPSISASNGTAAFTVNVGTGGTASSGTITLPSASNGWIAHVENLTALAANRADQRTVQTGSTQTSITVQNQTISTGAALAWTASDVLYITCIGY